MTASWLELTADVFGADTEPRRPVRPMAEAIKREESARLAVRQAEVWLQAAREYYREARRDLAASKRAQPGYIPGETDLFADSTATE